MFGSQAVNHKPNHKTRGGSVKAWNVYLNGKCIETVYFDSDINVSTVRQSLIAHDGYDPGIKVKSARLKRKDWL